MNIYSKASEIMGKIVVAGLPFSVLLGSFTKIIFYVQLYVPMIALLVLMYLIIAKKHVFTYDGVVVFLSLIYIVAHFVSISINQSSLIKGILSLYTFSFLFLIYLLAINIYKNEMKPYSIIFILIIFSSILSCQLIYKFIFNFDMSKINKDMIELSWGGSNYLAAFIVPFIPISFGFAIDARVLLQRLIWVLCCLFMLVSLILTMSKGAALSLIIVLMLIIPIFLSFKMKLVYFITMVTSIIFLIYFIPVVVPREFLELNKSLIEYRISNPDNVRSEIIKYAWEDFLDNPLVGIGPFKTQAYPERYQVMPHNFVLQVMAELGLLGSIPFFLIIIVFVFRSYENAKLSGTASNYGVFAGLIVTLLHGMTELTFQGIQYMVIYGLFMAAVSLENWKLKQRLVCCGYSPVKYAWKYTV